MIGALRAEWGKTFSIRTPVLCLIGTLLLVVVTAGMLGNDFVRSIDIGEQAPDARMSAVSALGPAVQFGLLTFAAFAMALITSEYPGGGMRSTLQAQPRRGVVLAAKSAIGAGIGLVCGSVTGGIGLAVSELALGGHSAPAAEPAALIALRVGTLFAVSAVLVMALGTIIRSAVGTLAAAAALLVGMLALPPAAGIWTPAGAAAKFIAADASDYPPSIGLLIVTGWAAAAYAVASVLFARRDA
ncbi:ABC transporter permease [Brevibacterium album]|uniref:ABC transporter permease n=1 Tax=Brevibacterium album TaxID=417948 RepID=UPI0004290BF4|nr:ABC transporter permease [Brevibacterium album]